MSLWGHTIALEQGHICRHRTTSVEINHRTSRPNGERPSTPHRRARMAGSLALLWASFPYLPASGHMAPPSLGTTYCHRRALEPFRRPFIQSLSAFLRPGRVLPTRAEKYWRRATSPR